MKMFVFDKEDGVTEITLEGDSNSSVMEEVYLKRNRFLADTMLTPSYLLISHEDYLSLMEYALWCDRGNHYYGNWDQVTAGLDNEFLGMRVVLRPGPIEVVGKARFELDRALIKRKKTD